MLNKNLGNEKHITQEESTKNNRVKNEEHNTNVARVKERTSFLQDKYGYTHKTAREYAYRIERMIRQMEKGSVLLWITSKKWHKREKLFLTLQGHEELQNQSGNRVTIQVIDIETGREIRIHIKDLLGDESRKRKARAIARYRKLSN